MTVNIINNVSPRIILHDNCSRVQNMDKIKIQSELFWIHTPKNPTYTSNASQNE